MFFLVNHKYRMVGISLININHTSHNNQMQFTLFSRRFAFKAHNQTKRLFIALVCLSALIKQKPINIFILLTLIHIMHCFIADEIEPKFMLRANMQKVSRTEKMCLGKAIV